VAWLPNARVYKCYGKHLKNKFSLKVGTIFEDSPIGLDKWLPVMWLLTNSRNGVSSWEIHRSMKVTQKTAWFMLQRGRLAMQDEHHGGKLGGPGCEVEADETFIGGKARNMHTARKIEVQKQGRNTGGKTIVMGILERNGTVRTKVLNDRKKHAVQTELRKHVEVDTTVYTDALQSYTGLTDFQHEVIDHALEYVRDNVHTNGMENFWSCLKRTLNGTYVSVEPFHLFRYLDEQAFRFNNRKPMRDAQRFRLVMRKIVGKRLTYAQLTGKEAETSAPDTF
jgi:transposase-like protein